MKNIPLHQRPLIYAAIRIAKRSPNFKPTSDHILEVVTYPELAFLKNIPDNDISKYSLEEPNIDINDFYTNLDQKNGVVITPPHIADLMVTLIQAKDKNIYDCCCGTGRLLENFDGKKILTELDHSNAIIAEAVLNQKIKQGSCFNDTELVDNSIGNPPYGQKGLSELKFIKHAADLTKKGGRVVFVVPKSVGTAKSNNEMKGKILRDHTLEAIISLPKDVFNGVGTSTIIMIIKTGTPHHISRTKTMFINFEDDGFASKKKGVRVEENYEERKEWLLETLYNQESVSGKSAYVRVDHEDEWGVEAHAYFTDYSKLTDQNFINDLKERLIYEYKTD